MGRVFSDPKRNLDAECARALGYDECGCSNDECTLWEPPEHLRQADGYGKFPRFSADPATTPMLLAEIARRGLWMEYTAALLPSLDLTGANITGSALWSAITATPEQHACAFVEVTNE